MPPLVSSLADEKAYNTLKGWTWTASQEPVAPTGPFSIGHRDVHGDIEADGLLMAIQMWQRTGQVKYRDMATAQADYWKNRYPSDFNSTDIPFFGCHTFIQGLIEWSIITGDASFRTTADTFAASLQSQWYNNFGNPINTSNPVGSQSSIWAGMYNVRGPGRMLLTAVSLNRMAWATDIWAHMRQSVCYKEIPSPYGTAGFWIQKDPSFPTGYLGPWELAEFSKGLYAYWEKTQDAVAKDRLIKIARFAQAFGVDLTTQHTGHHIVVNADFTFYHQGTSGPLETWYTYNFIDTLVRGYLLTGDRALLSRAEFYWERASKGIDGDPSPYLNRVPANKVGCFLGARMLSNNIDWVNDELSCAGLLFKAVLDSGGSPPGGSVSALSTLAASLQPGSWAELVTNGINVLLQPGSSGHCFEYGADAAWDPIAKKFHFIGNDHIDGNMAQALRFVAYDEATNTWTNNPPPPFSQPGRTDHGYYHHAVNPVNGDVYRRGGASSAVFYRLRSGVWQALPPAPIETNYASGGAIDYFPELGGLVFAQGGEVGGGSVYLFSETTQQWTKLADNMAALTGASFMAGAYSATYKIFIFGQGASFYKVTDSRVVLPISAPPFTVYDGSGYLGNIVADPVSGKFIALSATTRQLFTYDPALNVWAALSSVGKPNLTSFSVIAAPIANYGVVMYVVGQGSNCRVYLYKYAASIAVPIPPDPIPPNPGGTMNVEGNFDGILTGGVVSGWAIDPDNKPASVVMDIVIDGVVAWSGPTYYPRGDVNVKYSTTGNHGVRWLIPDSFRNGVPHSVSLKAVDLNTGVRIELWQSPQTFTIGTAPPIPIPPQPATWTIKATGTMTDKDGTSKPVSIDMTIKE